MNFKDMVLNVFRGFLIGIAELVPGFSASTFALIVDIYGGFVRFLHDVSDVFREVLKLVVGRSSVKKVSAQIKDIKYGFGVSLCIGIFFGVLAFSRVMGFALDNFPAYTNALFFGLILASVFVPLRQIRKFDFNSKAILILTTLLFLYIFNLNPTNLGIVPPRSLLFFGGFFSVCALVLPGVSGSFVLLIFGIYAYVISIINNLTLQQATNYELISLLTLVFGVFVGFITLLGLLKGFEEKYRSYLMSFLSGIMLASLRLVYPFITIKGHAIVHMFPWDMMLGQLIMILVIILVAYLAHTFLSKTITGKDTTIKKV